MAHLVKSLSSKTEDLGLVPNTQVKELSLAADAYAWHGGTGDKQMTGAWWPVQPNGHAPEPQ